MVVLEQEFRPQDVKGVLAIIAETLRQRGSINDTRTAAEEIASDALVQLKLFDKVFAARISNMCKCQIGARKPKVDYNHLMSDLRTFYSEFRTPVTNCEVNDFLKLSGAHSRVRKILDDNHANKNKVVLALTDLKEKTKWITCKECKTIGDVIIALEQPPSWIMVHVDRSFHELCRVLHRQHIPIRSVLSLEKET
jgi:hypothetical protein